MIKLIILFLFISVCLSAQSREEKYIKSAKLVNVYDEYDKQNYIIRATDTTEIIVLQGNDSRDVWVFAPSGRTTYTDFRQWYIVYEDSSIDSNSVYPEGPKALYNALSIKRQKIIPTTK